MFTRNRGLGNVFFIIAYTLVIITFSISMSSLNVQKQKFKKYSTDNNKSISFLKCKNVSFREFEDVIKNQNVSVILKKNTREGNEIITYLTTNGIYYKEDTKSGYYFEKEEFKNNNEKAVVSINFEGNPEISYMDKNNMSKTANLDVVGVSFERTPRITITAEKFKEIYNTNLLIDSTTQIIISGEENEIVKAINSIQTYVTSKDKANKIEINDYMEVDLVSQSKGVMKVSVFMLIITVINSITLAYLWIEERKKEFTVRKVVGATNKHLTKLFLKELSVLGGISAIASLSIQYVISKLSGGYIYNIPLKIGLFNIIAIAGTTIIILTLTILPFIYYLSKIQPVELLREG